MNEGTTKEVLEVAEVRGSLSDCAAAQSGPGPKPRRGWSGQGLNRTERFADRIPSAKFCPEQVLLGLRDERSTRGKYTLQV